MPAGRRTDRYGNLPGAGETWTRGIPWKRIYVREGTRQKRRRHSVTYVATLYAVSAIAAELVAAFSRGNYTGNMSHCMLIKTA